MRRLFPARLVTPDGTSVDPVSAWWDGTRLRVYAAREDAPPGTPTNGQRVVTVYDGTPEQVEIGATWTADGMLLARSSGCGCGHPLKRHRPEE